MMEIDKSLVGRPAVYVPVSSWSNGKFEKGKEYPCTVLFGGIEADEDGSTAIFVCEFPDGTVNHFNCYQIRFTDKEAQ